MQPGLTRAIPMAILGFLLASLVVIILRGLQQLDPLWLPGPGLVLSAFTSAGFFVWGMGAFDPKMSVHGEDAEAEHHEEAVPTPRALLSGQIWTLLTLMIVVLVAIMLFATFSGLALTMTSDPLASRTAVGYFPVELFGREMLISELVVFVVFVLVMFVSLALTAGALGWLLVFLARSIAEVKAAPVTSLTAPVLTSGTGGAAVVSTSNERSITLRHVIAFVILFVILYVLFYYILIGLALPAFVPATASIAGMPAQVVVNTLLSAVNAAVIAFLLVRPTILLHTVGRIAGWLVKILRRIPVLFQR